MKRYVVTYKHRGRRLAMLNGRVSIFSSKKSARRRAKEYSGFIPRIAKLKW